MTLPVLAAAGNHQVADPDTGELLDLRDASDHALAAAAQRVAELDRELFEAKRALAAELRDRHGVGATHAGGFAFTISESQSWPQGATQQALDELVRAGWISEADRERAMPSKPKPDTRALKALAGRLVVSNPDAAKVLADACTVSPPSVRDVRAEAVEGEAQAA